MPLGIATTDRKILYVGGALLAIMLAATSFLSPPGEEIMSPVPSTYSGQPAGAEAAYDLLARLHFHVRRWEDSPVDLPTDSANILLILADPAQQPTDIEKAALSKFVAEGGRVLFTGPSIGTYFPDAKIAPLPENSPSATYSPEFPSTVNQGISHIRMRPEAVWVSSDESQISLAGDGISESVISWSFGDGQILWWAGPTPLTNSGITTDDNLKLFLNSVSPAYDGEVSQIYWDEYFHGQRSSLWSYVQKTPLTWGLVQVGVVALAIFFTFSRRSGPVYIPSQVSRLSPLEFVVTLGGLYQRAGAAGSAVGISKVHLSSLLTRQMALPNDTSDADLAQAASARLGWDRAEIEGLLSRATLASRVRKLKAAEALRLVQDLEQWSDRLRVHTPYRRERK